MRISGTPGGGNNCSSSQKAAIKKQIEKLEARRDKILEKLGLKESSKKNSSTKASNGVVRVNIPSSGEQGTVSAPQLGRDGTESGEAVPQPVSVSVGTQDIGKALREMPSKMSSSSDDFTLSDEPKELLKELAAIEAQIASLRQQIDDNSTKPLEVDIEKAARLAASGMSAREADKKMATDASAPTVEGLPEISVPEVEVTNEGRVDGYV